MHVRAVAVALEGAASAVFALGMSAATTGVQFVNASHAEGPVAAVCFIRALAAHGLITTVAIARFLTGVLFWKGGGFGALRGGW